MADDLLSILAALDEEFGIITCGAAEASALFEEDIQIRGAVSYDAGTLTYSPNPRHPEGDQEPVLIWAIESAITERGYAFTRDDVAKQFHITAPNW